MPLAPCPRCKRHVRLDDAACPFCASALNPEEQSSILVPTATGRSRRAAVLLMATAATAAGAPMACEAYGAPGLPGPSMNSADCWASQAGPSSAVSDLLDCVAKNCGAECGGLLGKTPGPGECK